MTGAIPFLMPVGTARLFKVVHRIMEIILHAGAHRTSTTSFQHYLRSQADVIEADGTAVWGPRRTRKQLFAGLFPGPGPARGRDLRRRAEGRVQMHLELARGAGIDRVLVSEENMLGSSRHCARQRTLYPAVGERMARVNSAFAHQVSRVVLSIRSLDLWWSSALAYSVARGHNVPSKVALEQISAGGRSWRDVITDLSCAVPQAQIVVLPFEQFAGRPADLMEIATGRPAPRGDSTSWLNKAPDLADLRQLVAERDQDPALLLQQGGGASPRWQPFTQTQQANLREAYADDIFWLTAGADGLATLTEDPTRKRARTSLPTGAMTKGQHDEFEEGQLAQSGRR